MKYTKKEMYLFAKQIDMYDRAIAGENVCWDYCYMCKAIEPSRLGCPNCPLYYKISDDYYGNCATHKTYMEPDERNTASKKQLKARRDYLIKKLDEAGVEIYY